MPSGKTVQLSHFFFLPVLFCLACLAQGGLTESQEGKIICTVSVQPSERPFPDSFRTLAYHARGYEQVHQAITRHKISTLSYPVSLHCPKTKPSNNDEGFVFILKHNPSQALWPDRPDRNDSTDGFSDGMPSRRNDIHPDINSHIPSVNLPPSRQQTLIVPVSLFGGSMSEIEATLSVRGYEPEAIAPAAPTFPTERVFNVLQTEAEGTFWVYTLNTSGQWGSPFVTNLQDLPEDDYHGAIMVLASALSAWFGEQLSDNHQTVQIPGMIQAMIGGDAQSVTASGSGEGRQGTDQSSQSCEDERDQAGEGSGEGDDEEEKEEPPANPAEFIKSHYAQLPLDPALLALGFGLDPFASHFTELTVLNVIEQAYRRGLLQRMFHFALHYHNQIVEGHTGLGQWIHPQGASGLPDLPNLFYLAQIQPLDHHPLATLLQLPMVGVDAFVQRHPGNRRLWQLHVMEMATWRGVSWEKIEEFVRIVRSQVNSNPNPVPVVASPAAGTAAPDVIIVTQTHHAFTAQLDNQINTQIRQLATPRGVLNTLDARRQLLRLEIPPAAMRVFFAALGVNPSLTVRMKEAYEGIQKGRERIAGFGWSHIAVALHLAGYLHNQNAQFLQPYIQQYGNISVPPITTEISYHSLREQVAELLSQVTEASAQKTTVPSQPPKASPQQPSQNSCCVCLEENQQLVIFSPCGHKKVCKKCAGKVETCPVCRKPIQGKIDKVYE